MAKRVRELRAQGAEIVNLTLGEPDFDTPRHIKNAAVEAIRANFTKYPPVAGIPELRAAVAHTLNREYNTAYSAENVVVSTGAKQSLFNAVMALVDPGDEVIVPTPFWVSYRSMIELAEATPVYIPTTVGSGFKMKPEQLQAALTPRTRLLFLNSPSNPTGAMYSRAELEAICEVLSARPDIVVLSDEIYSMIQFGHQHISIAAIPDMAERTVTVTGVSKSFSMTGWRIGFAAAPVEIARLMERYQGQVTSGACSIAQRAAFVAMDNNLSSVYRMRTRFHQRRDAGMKALNAQLPQLLIHPPEGAFYFYPDCSAYLGKTTPDGSPIDTNDDLTRYLLEEARVAVVSGSAFGTHEHIRLSFACSKDTLRQGISQMAEALAKLA
jgi:aspartate aminotransferase